MKSDSRQEYFTYPRDKPNFLKTSNFVLEIRNIFLFQEIDFLQCKLFHDDPEAEKRNLELLKNARTGTMSKKTYVSLMEETFAERRTFVTKTAGSSAEVLEMCPYLGKQEHVSDMVCIGFLLIVGFQ